MMDDGAVVFRYHYCRTRQIRQPVDQHDEKDWQCYNVFVHLEFIAIISSNPNEKKSKYQSLISSIKVLILI
jgi:hypothetical protein